MKKTLTLFVILISSICNAQQEEIVAYIKRQSIGGKLDFTEVVEKQANGSPFIRYGNILYNKKDFALLMWGAKVKTLGLENIEEINQLWEEIFKRPLTDAEKRALKTGFELKIEN